VLGGWLAGAVGNRWVAVVGMAVAAVGYLLMSRWDISASTASSTAVVTSSSLLGLPAVPADLVVAGLGLGLVIAPVSDAVLRAVPAEHAGVAAAFVVVARSAGMLIGVAAVTAWGLHRFRTLTADLDTPLPIGIPQEQYDAQLADYQVALSQALLTEYREAFLLAAGACLLGAVVALALPGRPTRSEP
jgi:MFS family permease